MEKFVERLYTALENQLASVAMDGQSEMEQYRTAILICKKAMAKLKHYISAYSFTDEQQEINFFKTIKPKFYSKYIYFINVYNFLLQQPTGGGEIQQEYINLHIGELKSFFDHNRAFYAYYRGGMTQLDVQYFTRGGFDVQIELEDFEEDEQYSTSHDYKLSKIMANEKFQEYLNRELAKLNLNGSENFLIPFKQVNWTAGKTDAVELIYALKASGSVNGGNIDISELAAIWEYVFQVDLKEYYHRFADISRRKRETPVYMNKLRDSLLRFVDEKIAL